MTPTEHVCVAYEDKIYCFAAIRDKNKNMIHSDLTGQFPVRSYGGMSYTSVACVYKCTAILLHPMKSREDASVTDAFTSIYVDLEAIEHKHKLHSLDNECSCVVQNFLKIKNTLRQHVEVYDHSDTAAEPSVKSAMYTSSHTMPP